VGGPGRTTHHLSAPVCHDLGVGAFRYVLYAAVACSLSVYAYRAYRRWIAPHPPATDPLPDGTDSSTSTARSTTAGTPPGAARPPTVKRGLGFSDPNSLPSMRETDASESLVQQVIREEVARKKGLDPTAAPGSRDPAPATGRSGLFAGDDHGSADRVSVAAALTGVRLPEDLVPLVGDAAQPDPHHVTFISPSGPAAAIGRHLGDELERLGYQVRSETDVVAIATKGAVNLRVTLHPDAGTERVDGAARFPTAAANSVVVEFQT
jgi:hypothetical protein